MINAPKINEIVLNAFRARFSDLDFFLMSFFEALDLDDKFFLENRDPPVPFDPFTPLDSKSRLSCRRVDPLLMELFLVNDLLVLK